MEKLDYWAVIGDLNEKSLAYSSSKGFFLISPDAPPESCFCFQNEALTQISPPLLIEVKREGSSVFLLWDGKDLKERGDLDIGIRYVLWIAPEQYELLEQGECELRSLKIEDNKWAVIMNLEFRWRSK